MFANPAAIPNMNAAPTSIRRNNCHQMLQSLLQIAERRAVFHNWGPARMPKGRPAGHEDVRLTTSDGLRLHARYYGCPDEIPWPISDERPTVLFFHGTCGTVQHWHFIGPRWQDAIGAHVLLLDYRGYGESQGAPTEEGLYRDGRAAYDWLVQSRGVDPQRLVIAGQSLGGGVAVELATSRPHAALVLESTFTSVPEVAQRLLVPSPVRRRMRCLFPSEQRLAGHAGPVFISHGDRDRLIPLSHAERLLAAAAGPKEMLVIPGLPHLDRRADDYGEEVRRFLGDTLSPKLAAT